MTSPQMTSPQVTSPHVTFDEMTSPQTTPPQMTPPRIASPQMKPRQIESAHTCTPHRMPSGARAARNRMASCSPREEFLLVSYLGQETWGGGWGGVVKDVVKDYIVHGERKARDEWESTWYQLMFSPFVPPPWYLT